MINRIKFVSTEQQVFRVIWIRVRQCQHLHMIMTKMLSQPINGNCNKLNNDMLAQHFCLAIWRHRPRDNRYLRRCSGKSRHPSLKQTSPKHKRVFANKDEINQLKDCKLVKKDAANYCNDKPSKLRHNISKIIDT